MMRPRAPFSSGHHLVRGWRLFSLTVDFWEDQVVLGRVGGLERWCKLAHLCWRPRSWRDVIYVRRPWGPRP